jgi:hypothetical protein
MEIEPTQQQQQQQVAHDARRLVALATVLQPNSQDPTTGNFNSQTHTTHSGPQLSAYRKVLALRRYRNPNYRERGDQRLRAKISPNEEDDYRPECILPHLSGCHVNLSTGASIVYEPQ